MTAQSGRGPLSRRPKALIVLSAARVLRLAEPQGHPGVPTGFFLCELTRVLEEFAETHEFVFATENGRAPQLDVNSLALEVPARSRFVAAARRALRLDANRSSDCDPRLVARRAADLRVAYHHLGRLPVSRVLPNTDPEVKLMRDEVACCFRGRPELKFHALPDLIWRHHDRHDEFSLGDFDFTHLPGGYAPLVDFVDNPWLGELLNVQHEHGVVLSLVCHAPIALTSMKYRVRGGLICVEDDHPFQGIPLTVASEPAAGFLKVPKRRTRLPYYADLALRDAGYDVRTPRNLVEGKVVWADHARVLTSNGPQAMDEHVAALRRIVDRAA